MSSAKLIVDGIGQWVYCHELPPSGEVIIGRSSSCDVQLKSLHVSGRHARVTVEADGTFVEAVSQSNATHVNGQPLTGRRRLKSGDNIRIEPYTLTFQSTEVETPEKTLGGMSIDELLAARRDASVRAADEDQPVVEQLARATLELKKLGETGGATGTLGDGAGFREALMALDAAQRSTRRALRQRELLRVALFSSLESECYQRMLDATLKALRAEIAFLMLINPATGAWEVKARSKGFEDFAAPAADEGGRPPISLTLVSFAVKTKKAVLTQDMPDETRGGAMSIVAHNISTGIAAPLLEEGKVIGCLYLDRREHVDQLYGKADLDDAAAYAESFADVAEHWHARRRLFT